LGGCARREDRGAWKRTIAAEPESDDGEEKLDGAQREEEIDHVDG
jgi:hypothetical protein